MDGCRDAWWFPIAGGAAVGLVVGAIGLYVINPVLAFLGAVGGGTAAAALSDRGVVADVAYAGLADLTSSIVFFVVAIAAVFPTGDTLFSAGLSMAVFGSWGLIVAIPVAVLSLAVAVGAGLLTSLGRRYVPS